MLLGVGVVAVVVWKAAGTGDVLPALDNEEAAGGRMGDMLLSDTTLRDTPLPVPCLPATTGTADVCTGEPDKPVATVIDEVCTVWRMSCEGGAIRRATQQMASALDMLVALHLFLSVPGGGVEAMETCRDDRGAAIEM